MTLNAKKVLVTGGTGFIGGRVVERLVLEQGAQVRVLVRNFSKASRIARFNLEMMAGDIADPAAVKKALQDCTVVFHCAHDFISDRRMSHAGNVAGTKNIVEACLKNNSRLIYTSSADVYGWPADGMIDENSPKEGHGNVYAETKQAAEQAVQEGCRKGLRAVILQPTIVYGPFSRPWTVTPLQQLRTGRVVLVNGGDGRCNAVYLDDVVDALFLAAETDAGTGEEFIVSGPASVAWKDFYGAYEKMLGLQGTVSKSAGEITPGSGAKKTGEWQQFMAILKDPDFHYRLLQAPVIGRMYRGLTGCVPRRLRQYVSNHIFQPGGSSVPPSQALAERCPVYMPDPWRTRLCASKAEVRMDKARQKLGYSPKYDFEKGMAVTREFAAWANLL